MDHSHARTIARPGGSAPLYRLAPLSVRHRQKVRRHPRYPDVTLHRRRLSQDLQADPRARGIAEKQTTHQRHCDLAWDIIPSQDHSLYTLIPHTQACTVDASYVHSESKHSRYIMTRSRMVARCFSMYFCYDHCMLLENFKRRFTNYLRYRHPHARYRWRSDYSTFKRQFIEDIFWLRDHLH